ncbi:MAG: hypothetical protein KAR06_11765 [Deltaproteobacteria bacterium]|nr:hypothetical protein [Deltaproteobacteria bacterium]
MSERSVKAGLKTTEFWVALVAVVIPVLNTHLGTSIPLEATLTIGGIVIAYIMSRAVAKKAS